MSKKTAMSELEIAAATCLDACRFRQGSYAERFAHEVCRIANSEYPELTEGQRYYLWVMCWLHRDQIKDKPGGAIVVDEATRVKVDVPGSLWIDNRYFPVFIHCVIEPLRYLLEQESDEPDKPLTPMGEALLDLFGMSGTRDAAASEAKGNND